MLLCFGLWYGRSVGLLFSVYLLSLDDLYFSISSALLLKKLVNDNLSSIKLSLFIVVIIFLLLIVCVRFDGSMPMSSVHLKTLNFYRYGASILALSS